MLCSQVIPTHFQGSVFQYKCSILIVYSHTMQFFLQLATQFYSVKRCKFVINVWYVKNMLANCDGNLYLPILHLPIVELHFKLREKLHRVTGPLTLG